MAVAALPERCILSSCSHMSQPYKIGLSQILFLKLRLEFHKNILKRWLAHCDYPQDYLLTGIYFALSVITMLTDKDGTPASLCSIPASRVSKVNLTGMWAVGRVRTRFSDSLELAGKHLDVFPLTLCTRIMLCSFMCAGFDVKHRCFASFSGAAGATSQSSFKRE